MRLNVMTAEDLADLEPVHVCGTCRHFHSVAIAEEEPYEKVGICGAMMSKGIEKCPQMWDELVTTSDWGEEIDYCWEM